MLRDRNANPPGAIWALLLFVIVISVSRGSTASLSHLVIRDGVALQGGGVFVDSGNVTIDHSLLTANAALGAPGAAGAAGSPGQGGAIYIRSGSLSLVWSTVDGNQA